MIQDKENALQEKDRVTETTIQVKRQSDYITRETTSTVEPTAGRTRTSHSRDPALSTETGGTTTTTAESASCKQIQTTNYTHPKKER